MIAISSLGALAHETRIDVFRLLVRAGSAGVLAGDIAATLGVRANTLSNNLSVLSAAGLVRHEREGRAVRYFLRPEAMRALLGFLLEDCCGGAPEHCGPLLDEITCACPGAGQTMGTTA